MKAKDFDQYRQNMEMHTNTSNNTLFADSKGNIAFFNGNFVPKRDPSLNWAQPVDGSDPKTEWQGMTSVEDSPFMKNPASGWVYNTNDYPWDVAGAGTLKQVFTETGVEKNISAALLSVPIDPLLLGWLIAGVIRVSLGSATVAGMTAAGLMAPVVASGNVNPNLMVLAVGAGSLMFSHVNDSGFWMAKEYFNLSLKETIMSWTLMEGIVGVVGIIGVLILEAVIL
jgi:hypothetical protein